MKTTMLLTLMTISFMSVAQAGRLEKYIEPKTGRVVEVSTSETPDAGLSKSTSQRVAGVKAGETILLTTYIQNSTQTISRYCDVYTVFENKMAQVGCLGTEADRLEHQDAPKRLDFIVTDLSEATAEVQSLDGFEKGEKAQIAITTKNLKAGRKVRIIAIYTNGEALVEKTGYSFFNSQGVVPRGADFVDRIRLTDLNKI